MEICGLPVFTISPVSPFGNGDTIGRSFKQLLSLLFG